jgi:pimeloyl-ACP methyl ester carboxylesterase
MGALSFRITQDPPGADLRMYDAQVAHLSGRYRCVAYDHRGQGQSRDDGSPYDMERLTEDAAQLIERLGLASCACG